MAKKKTSNPTTEVDMNDSPVAVSFGESAVDLTTDAVTSNEVTNLDPDFYEPEDNVDTRQSKADLASPQVDSAFPQAESSTAPEESREFPAFQEPTEAPAFPAAPVSADAEGSPKARRARTPRSNEGIGALKEAVQEMLSNELKQRVSVDTAWDIYKKMLATTMTTLIDHSKINMGDAGVWEIIDAKPRQGKLGIYNKLPRPRYWPSQKVLDFLESTIPGVFCSGIPPVKTDKDAFEVKAPVKSTSTPAVHAQPSNVSVSTFSDAVPAERDPYEDML